MHTLKTQRVREPEGQKIWYLDKCNGFQVERAEKAVRGGLRTRALGVGPGCDHVRKTLGLW